jgi:hypothetical protein
MGLQVNLMGAAELSSRKGRQGEAGVFDGLDLFLCCRPSATTAADAADANGVARARERTVFIVLCRLGIRSTG